MTKINLNVKGVLEHIQRNEDGTFKIKILGDDGDFHIYSKLTSVLKKSEYEVGDCIGEADDLYYAVKKQLSKVY